VERKILSRVGPEKSIAEDGLCVVRIAKGDNNKVGTVKVKTGECHNKARTRSGKEASENNMMWNAKYHDYVEG